MKARLLIFCVFLCALLVRLTLQRLSIDRLQHVGMRPPADQAEQRSRMLKRTHWLHSTPVHVLNLPSVATECEFETPAPELKPPDSRFCAKQSNNAYILEATQVHREVLPSVIWLTHAAGFKCITVLHKTPRGEHGIIHQMALWGVHVKVRS